jgi:hypothetical protein
MFRTTQSILAQRGPFVLSRQKRLLHFRLLRPGLRSPGFGVPRRDRDLFRRQCGPYPGPGKLEAQLAVLEIDGRAPVVGSRRLSIEVAAPPPMRAVELLHDSSNQQPAPNHLVVVSLDLAFGDRGAQSDGFQIVGHGERASRGRTAPCGRWYIDSANNVERVAPALRSYRVFERSGYRFARRKRVQAASRRCGKPGCRGRESSCAAYCG